MMTDGQEIQDISSVLGNVFQNLGTQEARRANDIFSIWRKVLLGIKNSTNPSEGANLAAHSRIVDLKNGVLLVEADHPGWIELLQLRKRFILKGLSFYAKDLRVETLAFRLAGKRGNVSGAGYSTGEARGLAEGRVEKEEAALAKWGFADGAGRKEGSREAGRNGTGGPTGVAPALEAALAALKRDMGA